MLNDDFVREKISNIEEHLKEILKWLKVSSLRQVRETLEMELNTYEKKRIYELTDGKKSQKQIGTLVGISRRSVSYYWQKWQGLGILVSSEHRKGRMKKIISLSEVGITLPERKMHEPEMTFKPQNLKLILNNVDFFPDLEELWDFSIHILPFRVVRENLKHLSRIEFVDVIIDTFKRTDSYSQALFMQALETRARERRDTQFSKYFESWEKQIKG